MDLANSYAKNKKYHESISCIKEALPVFKEKLGIYSLEYLISLETTEVQAVNNDTIKTATNNEDKPKRGRKKREL